MLETNFRKILYEKYKNMIPNIDKDVYTIDEKIEHLNKCISHLNNMLLDIREFYYDNEYKYYGSTDELDKSSTTVVNKINELMMDDDQKEELISYNCMLNLLHFIYNEENKNNEITKTEISYMKIIISSLIYRFSELLCELNDDYYMGRYQLKKKISIFKKSYYDFYVDNEKVGSGWIRKRNTRLFNSIYLKIKSEYRRKKYGTKFYGLLVAETNEKVDYLHIMVKKNNEIANKFIESIVGKYETKYTRFNKNVYINTIIID